MPRRASCVCRRASKNDGDSKHEAAGDAAARARPLPLKPEEKDVICTGFAWAMTSPASMPMRRSWIVISVTPLSRALDTLDMPGCLPTTRMSVLPEIEPVT